MRRFFYRLFSRWARSILPVPPIGAPGPIPVDYEQAKLDLEREIAEVIGLMLIAFEDFTGYRVTEVFPVITVRVEDNEIVWARLDRIVLKTDYPAHKFTIEELMRADPSIIPAPPAPDQPAELKIETPL